MTELFRYEGSMSGGSPYIYYRTFLVEKETPKGYWISDYAGRRFVLKESRKRYAYPTLKEALESFMIRKLRQFQILAKQYDKAKALHKFAEEKIAIGQYDAEERKPTLMGLKP